MNTFLSHDWAGLVIAAVIALVGWVVWRIARSRSSKWLRWPLSGLGGFVAVIGGVLFIGAIVHLVEIVRVSAKHPLPGEAFDVGGYRLHLMRNGENHISAQGRTPTLVLVSGGYAQGLALHHLYEALAKDTRTIIFDRAGAGWSERSPEPRLVRNDAADLKRLLEAAGEPGPYVLAGHSWGGLFAYEFAAFYPELTAGVVLLDATPFEFVGGRFSPSLSGFGMVMKLGGIARLFALEGVFNRAIGFDIGEPGDEGFLFPPLANIWELYKAGDIRARGGIAGAESMMENIAQSDDLITEPGALGNIPMLVIYQESILPDPSTLTPEQQEQARVAMMKAFKMTAEDYEEFMRDAPALTQKALDDVAALSNNSTVIHPPEKSTHQFPYEHPEWVADRIREMIEKTRGSSVR